MSWGGEKANYSEDISDLRTYDVASTYQVIHSKDKTIPITDYTGLTMKTYYVIFLVGMMFHFLVMLIKNTKEESKMNHQLPQKKQKRRSISPFLRAFTSFVIPEVSTDWDEIDGLDHYCGGYENVVEVI